MAVRVDEVPTPERADEASWVAFHRLQQVACDEELGAGARRVTPEAALQRDRADRMYATRRWLAWLGSQPVGFAMLDVNTADEPDGGFITVFVDPQFRRRGIGRRLANRVREELGEETLRLASEISTPMPSGEVLTPPNGIGKVPADHPGVRLALSYGFRLGQVGRIGRYDFADPAVPLHQVLA